jgi:hypothetical protein
VTNATTTRPPRNAGRTLAWTTAFALLAMAILAPVALYGVLGSLIVPGDPITTVTNITESEGLFRVTITAFLVVILLDVFIAWALYKLLRPVNSDLSLLTAWLRIAFAAVFASALIRLVDAAQLVGGADMSGLAADQIQAQVMTSLASFDNGWIGISLSIFAFHLFGLGFLLIKSVNAPAWLGALLIIAGGGYLVDGVGKILVPDYTWTIGMFTFIGEAVLIGWTFWRAVKGFAPESGEGAEPPAKTAAIQPAPVAS